MKLKKLLSGNEAIARGSWECGVRFGAGYPGTPSTEILEYMAQYKEVDSQWSPNEKVAFEVAAGASIGGARSIATMKHVGVNVAADPLFSFSYMGVNGGFVLVSADDPSLHSSQNEQDNRHYAVAAKVPLFEPADSQEAKDFTKEAFDVSEKFDTLVIMRMTTRTCHSKGVVTLEDRIEPAGRGYIKDYKKYVLLPSNAKVRHAFVEERTKRLEEYSNSCKFNRIEKGDTKIGIITAGVAYQYAKEVFPNASILKLGMLHPLPRKLITKFSKMVDKLIIIEELDPFIEMQVKAMGIKVTGKDKIPILFELTQTVVRDSLKTKPKKTSIIAGLKLPGRPPVMCPGCSHRGMFHSFKRLKLTVTGDIGCYTLGALPPLETMDTCMCMGASIGAALGLEKAEGAKISRKMVAVIGDSTFIHSGITPLIDVVYNKGTTTVCILNNTTTAMTGHQEHPGTGLTLKEDQTKSLDIYALAQAVGVKRVVKVDPYNLKEVRKVLKEEIKAPEPSVIISDAPCIIKAKKKLGVIKEVDRDVCNECKLCLDLGCPAIEVYDNKPKINQFMCVGCDMCGQVCMTGAIHSVSKISGK
jgi:indolepyruvate ferredoxin oxidoreductase, alpha subunit